MVSWLIWNKKGVEQQDLNPNQKLKHFHFTFIVRSIDHGAHHKEKAILVIAKVAVAKLAQLSQLGQDRSRTGSSIIQRKLRHSCLSIITASTDHGQLAYLEQDRSSTAIRIQIKN